MSPVFRAEVFLSSHNGCAGCSCRSTWAGLRALDLWVTQLAMGDAVLAEGGAVLAEGGTVLAEGGAVLAEGGAVLAEGGLVLAAWED